MFFKELIKSYPLTFLKDNNINRINRFKISSQVNIFLYYQNIFPTFYFRYLILKMPSKEHLARILQYVGFEISNSTNELSKTYFNSYQNT